MFYKRGTTDTQDQQGFNGRQRGCGGGPFGKNFGERIGNKAAWMQAAGFGPGSRKSANIEENENAFIISLYAAGLDKNNFKVSSTNDVLNISYTAPEGNEAMQGKFVHQEYQPQSFSRSFQLNGKVLTDNISATYTDGVLKVILVKNPETNKPAQEVKVD